MCITESGRVIRQQSDFGITYVALCFPSGQICPDIRTVCPDAPRATRPSSLSLTLAHRVRPFLLASARHEDLVQAAGLTPLSRHIPARRGGSTGPGPRTSTAAEPRG